MCGITGFISNNGRAETCILHAMLKAIIHRGPDSLGGFVDGGVALGSARLSIVDLEGGVQPAVSADGKVVVVFNGEIFNYQDLRKQLSQKNVHFRTNSEVETLLWLYQTYGEDMFKLLNGQYAVAVWDGRQERLLLCRDRIGIRPLFWLSNKEGITFASEIKALAANPGVELRLNPRSLVQTFRFWTNVGDTTAFEGIHQVPAGHYLILEKGKSRLERYWEWPFPDNIEQIALPNDEAYFERFIEELNLSIRRQCMADVPIGSYLSGGIDSSVIAICLQRQMTGNNLKTYSVTFEDPEYDESRAQQLVNEHYHFEHSSVYVHSRDIGENFPQVVWHVETPLFRTAPTPLFLLSRRVYQDGIKVVMTGEGADEVLLGYDLFREAAIRRFWSKRPDSKWRGSLFKKLYFYLPQYRNPRYFNLLLDFYRPTLLDPGDPHYAMAVRWANGKALELYLSEDMRAFTEEYNPVADLERWLPSSYFEVGDIERAQYIEVLALLGNYLLSSQGDRMSMAHAVEGRYPYLDHQFIEFVARLPKRLKLRGLKDKFILRNAFGSLIPDEVRKRPKVAYQAPDLKGFITDGYVPEYVESLLSPDRIKETGLFDPARVAQLMAKGRSTNLARMGNRDNMAFVLVLSTMLLDDIFVRRNWSLSSDIPVSKPLRLIGGSNASESANII
jgi:asparagine synthase (glutamine-hydrolysing)